MSTVATLRDVTRPGREVLGWVAVLALLALLPSLTSVPYFISTGITALTFVTLAVAFDLVVGRVGALSLAQPVFYGFGAYAAAIMSSHAGTLFWPELAVACLGGVVLALLIGIPSFRLSLHAFAIGTLAFQVSAQLIANNWVPVTGGPICITGIGPISLGWPLGVIPQGDLAGEYYVILGIAAAAIGVTLWVTRVRLGIAFTSVRDDPVLASARGLWPLQVRLIAFALSAALSAAAGAFVAHFQTVICPDSVGIEITVALLIMVFIGGRSSLRGVVSAALLFTVLPQVLRVAEEWRLVIYGGILLVIVTTFPGGLEQLYQSVEHQLRRALGRRPAAPGAEDTGNK